MKRYVIAALAVAALLIILALLRETPFQAIEKPNILLISIDTLRADHLSSYGYSRNTTPTIDRLAGNGVRFSHAISQAPWTLPSTASMLTSLYPRQHGAVQGTSRIPDNIETLAEALEAHGYSTTGITSNRFIDRRHGLAQGFRIFDESQVPGHNAVTSQLLTQVAIEQLDQLKDPFFLWIHYFDPHYTYVRHPEFKFATKYKTDLPDALKIEFMRMMLRRNLLTTQNLNYIQAVYDEEIAFTDLWIGKLLEHLEKQGKKESTVIILTADHGEYFLERGRLFHGKDVYRELIDVPLVISGAIPPRFRNRTIERRVEVRSIPKTVAELTGISSHPFQGENLLHLAQESTPLQFLFAEGSYALGTDKRKAAIFYDDWKMIRNLDDNKYELYNLSSDPAEIKNLWDEPDPEIARRQQDLKEELDRFCQNQITETPKTEFSPEEIERLRALGYVQ